MNSRKKIAKILWFLPALLLVPVLFASAALTGQQIYDQQCSGCHSLGTYDTSGSPNLLGDGSLVAGKFASSHKGITLTSTDITNVAAFINNPTPAATPLAISTATLAGGTVGTAYSQPLAATGGTTPYTWSRSSGTLPTGLTLASNGTISGTPTAAGTYSFTVTVTDSAATKASVSKALSITVTATSGPLTISTSSLVNATLGTAYSQALSASGGKAPYTWSRSAGTLPTGLTLSSAGVISGTPAANGTFSFTVKVTDSATTAATTTKSLSITVSSVPLSITTASLPGGSLGTAYSQTLSATGGVSPYSWSYNGTLPAGILISSAGSVTGTPTAAGTYSFTVLVADSKSTTATKALSLVITAPMTSASKTLFNNNCLACHSAYGLQNTTASQIQAAITGNVGGMGTTQLKALSSTDVANISAALTPPTPPAWNCTACHGSTVPGSGSGSGTTSTDGATLYATYCASCHGSLATSNKLGTTAALIQTGITNNIGGMGTPALQALTSTQIQAIATALSSGSGSGSGSGTATCGSCHGIPPSTGHHSTHSSYSCSTCHGSGYSKTTVNTATHNNGTVNIATTIGWNTSANTCSNSCHGTKTW